MEQQQVLRVWSEFKSLSVPIPCFLLSLLHWRTVAAQIRSYLIRAQHYRIRKLLNRGCSQFTADVFMFAPYFHRKELLQKQYEEANNPYSSLKRSGLNVNVWLMKLSELEQRFSDICPPMLGPRPGIRHLKGWFTNKIICCPTHPLFPCRGKRWKWAPNAELCRTMHALERCAGSFPSRNLTACAQASSYPSCMAWDQAAETHGLTSALPHHCHLSGKPLRGLESLATTTGLTVSLALVASDHCPACFAASGKERRKPTRCNPPAKVLAWYLENSEQLQRLTNLMHEPHCFHFSQYQHQQRMKKAKLRTCTERDVS